MAGEGAHQRTRLALRAQRGVDRPDACPRRCCAEQTRIIATAASVAADLSADGLVRAVHGLGDEHHVDVADVVELAAAALAHGDDGQPARRCAPRRARPRAMASAASRVAPARSASSAATSATSAPSARSRAASPGAALAVGDAQRVGRRRRRPGDDRHRVVRVGADLQRASRGAARPRSAGRSLAGAQRASARGWRTRWSVSARLAPSTAEQPVAARPRRSQLECTSSAGVGLRRRAAGARPSRAASGSAVSAEGGEHLARRPSSGPARRPRAAPLPGPAR